MRNGFIQADTTANPLLIENPNLERPVVEIHFLDSINGPEFIDETPLDKGLPCRFSPGRSPEQVIFELKEKDDHVPVNDSSLKVDVKSIVKNIHEENNRARI
jgi:hypothetical protein